MRAMIESVCKSLVDHEESVKVRETQADSLVVFEVTVHPQDFGQLIGRQGEHAKALRLLLKSAGRKKAVDAHLNIVDPHPKHTARVPKER